MTRPRGTCIYCGRHDVTKQHVWPDWLKSVLPRDEEGTIQVVTGLRPLPGRHVLVEPRMLFPRGHRGTRKIRNVCGTCNGGWMSRLEKLAKPSLTSLILGRPISLSSSDQRAIAAWAVMTSITAEFTDPRTLCIPVNDRLHLMNEQEPTANWRIFIGRYTGPSWKLRYSHFGCQFRSMSEMRWRPLGVQASIFVAGDLVLYACSCSADDAEILERLRPPDGVSLQNVWPSQASPIASDEAAMLDDSSMAELATHALSFPPKFLAAPKQ
jgi:hypothetical protein